MRERKKGIERERKVLEKERERETYKREKETYKREKETYKREKKRRIRERERKKETYEREDLTSGVHFVEHMLCCVLTCHSSTRHQPKVFSNFLTSPERRFFGGGGFKYQNERQPVISL